MFGTDHTCANSRKKDRSGQELSILQHAQTYGEFLKRRLLQNHWFQYSNAPLNWMTLGFPRILGNPHILYDHVSVASGGAANRFSNIQEEFQERLCATLG